MPPQAIVLDIVSILLDQLPAIFGDQPEIISWHAGEHMVLIMKVKTSIKEICPSATSYINVCFNLPFWKTHILVLINISEGLPVVIRYQL